MLWLWAALLLLAMIAAWMLNFVGLPGNWINLALAALYAWLIPTGRTDFAWLVLIILLLLAVVGELVEFLAGAMGVAQVGGTKRGAALAVVGSIGGGIAGLFLGVPIPVVGSVVGALLFSCLGAMLGAMIGEQWAGRDFDSSVEVGHGAFWGRLFGTLGKVIVGSVMIMVTAAAIVI